MTRSTHIKSKKRGTRKRGTRKRGTRKPQSGGVGYLDWFSSYFKKGDSPDQQSKDAELKQKLTNALNELTQILPKVKICAKESEMETEEARRVKAEEDARRVKAEEEARRVKAEDDARRLEEEARRVKAEAAPEQPITGGSKSRRSGRGRAPPKGIPKGGPKGKKGMMVGPRKGPIIF